MPETLKGSCHCRAVTFTVRLDDAIETSRCNCSICTPARFWKTIVPSDAFTLDSGADALGRYQFGSGTIVHHFCTRCGIKLHGVVSMEDGEVVAISVPTLHLSAERLASLPVTFQDGAHDDYDRSPPIVSYL